MSRICRGARSNRTARLGGKAAEKAERVLDAASEKAARSYEERGQDDS
jgi:hypothetical protein